jgi:hypothetical protein
MNTTCVPRKIREIGVPCQVCPCESGRREGTALRNVRKARDEVHRAARRKILRKVAPLATGAQGITPFMTARMFGAALAAARLRRWNEWLDIRPLVVRRIARVPQVIIAVIPAFGGRRLMGSGPDDPISDCQVNPTELLDGVASSELGHQFTT